MADKRASKNLDAKFPEGLGPADILAQVMLGTESIMHRGKQVKISQKMIDAAKDLMPYYMPKLAQIEAQIATVELTHEEWIASIDGGSDG